MSNEQAELRMAMNDMKAAVPAPEDAARTLREVSRRRWQVRATSSPLWAYAAACLMLMAYGVALDAWPRFGGLSAWIVVLFCLAFVVLPRIRRTGSAMGYRVAYRPAWLSRSKTHIAMFLVTTRVVAIAIFLAVVVSVGYLRSHLHVPYRNTIVFGVLGLLLLLGRPLLYPVNQARSGAADDVK
jgi:hypothetical protein